MNYPRPVIEISKQDSSNTFNHHFLNFFAMGNRRLISGVMWATTLLEADQSHYKGQPLNNWLFHRFITISYLDPYFYENYYYGGQYLGIIKDDPEGAKILFKRGVEFFDDDFWLNYNLALVYYFDLNDINNSLIYFEKVLGKEEQLQYIQSLPSLISKIKAESGNLQIAFDFLLSVYKNRSEDNHITKKFRSNLYALKAEIDLNCLNSGEKNCSNYDFENRPYLFVNERFIAAEKWKKNRPYKNNK